MKTSSFGLPNIYERVEEAIRARGGSATMEQIMSATRPSFDRARGALTNGARAQKGRFHRLTPKAHGGHDQREVALAVVWALGPAPSPDAAEAAE